VDFAGQTALGTSDWLPAVFKAPAGVRVHRHGHGVQRQDGLGDPVGVQLTEQPVDYPVLDPAVETLVDYVPVAVFLRQSPSFAAVFTYAQRRVYEGDVSNRYPATLDGQYAPDFPVCPLVYFHTFEHGIFCQVFIVGTRPRAGLLCL